MTTNKRPMDRRSMLRTAGRHITLAGLGFLAWKLVSRRGGECRYTATCTDCQLLAHCQLPTARRRRANHPE